MQSSAFSGFDWDDGNVEKCQKHGVSVEDIESIFANAPLIGPDAAHSVTEPRMRAFGRGDSGRPIFVVFTLRLKDGEIYFRPISARYMHAKEVQRYDRSG
jgi:uncharacterized protein